MSKGSKRRPTLDKELAEKNWLLFEQNRLSNLRKNNEDSINEGRRRPSKPSQRSV